MTATEEVDTGARRRRRRRIWIGAGALAAVLIVFVLVWFEPQAAFIDDSVDESLPGLDAVLATGTTTPPAPTTTAPAGSADTTVTTSPDTAAPDTNAPANTVPETTALAAPANSVSAALLRASDSGAPVVVSSGTFISGEHDTAGTALVVALPDGSLVVRFEDLDTSNGPDLRVVLSPEPASDSWKYDDRLHLGELKGNLGDQNYDVDAGVDLSGYRSVVIWCERFSVAFGAAPIDVVA
jgi:hypothetical protein